MASSTILWVFGITRPGIELRSPRRSITLVSLYKTRIRYKNIRYQLPQWHKEFTWYQLLRDPHQVWDHLWISWSNLPQFGLWTDQQLPSSIILADLWFSWGGGHFRGKYANFTLSSSIHTNWHQTWSSETSGPTISFRISFWFSRFSLVIDLIESPPRWWSNTMSIWYVLSIK